MEETSRAKARSISRERDAVTQYNTIPHRKRRALRFGAARSSFFKKMFVFRFTNCTDTGIITTILERRRRGLCVQWMSQKMSLLLSLLLQNLQPPCLSPPILLSGTTCDWKTRLSEPSLLPSKRCRTWSNGHGTKRKLASGIGRAPVTRTCRRGYPHRAARPQTP